jgi:fibronectin-binding autotransporter adhesin
VAGNITDNATVAFNRSDSFTHAGVISGTGALTKSGGGTLTLSGANTYTGSTTINAGTLALGAANRLSNATNVSVASIATFGLAGFNETVGSIGGAGGIALGAGALTAGGSGASTTVSGIISGTGGAFTKVGAGTLILSNANTYTGGTTISGGTLQFDDGGSVVGNITNNATLAFNRSDSFTYADVISGGGSVTKLGNGTLTLSTNQSYSGTTTITAGTLALDGINRLFANASVSIGSGATFALQGFDQTVGNISGSGNITLGSATLSTGYFNNTTFSGTISGSGSLSVRENSLLTLSGTNTYTGNTNVAFHSTLQFAQRSAFYNGVVDGGTAAKLQAGDGTVNFNVGGAGEFTSADITTLAGSVSDSILGLDASNAGGAFTLSGNIGGTFLLEQIGGTIILTGTNTFPGTTFIDNHSTLQIGNGGTTGSLSSNISNTNHLIFNRSDDIAFTSVISGSGTIQKLGAGTLTLSGKITNSIGITVSAGTFQFAKTTSFYDNEITGGNASRLTVASGTTAAFNVGGDEEFTSANITTLSGANFASGSKLGLDTTNASGGAFTQAGNLGGALGLAKLGGGTLTLSGTNTYAGNTTVTAGTLQFANTSAFYNSTIDATTADRLSVATGATAAFNVGGAGEFTAPQIDTLQTSGHFPSGSTIGLDTTNATDGTFTYNGTLSGDYGINKLGSGTLTFTGENFYTGGTTVSAGTLLLTGSSFDLNDDSAVIVNGGTLALGAGDQGLGSLAGTGGTVNLFNGSGRTLFVGSNGASTTYAGVIAGAGGSLEKIGAGTLTLTGTNTYTGTTRISVGTLQADNASALGSGGPIAFGTATAGGTLKWGSGNTTDYSNRFTTGNSQGFGFDTNGNDITLANGLTSTGGALIKSGLGTLTLNGNVSFGGSSTTQVRGGTLAIPSGVSFATGGLLSVGSITGTNGALRIDSGASVTSGTFTIGSNATSIGAVTMNGGTAGTSTFTVGATGSGNLNLTGGTLTATVGRLGNAAAGIGVATVSGGSWVNTTSLSIGLAGTGTLTISGTGHVDAGSSLSIATSTGSTGTLNLGNGGALDPSALVVSGSISGGSGTATVNFNHTGSYAFSPPLAGSLSVNKSGSGTTTLSGTNTYTGATAINGGTLVVDGSITGATTINSTGTLGGHGTVGAVTINTGGKISPGNSPGTMNTGAETWNGGGSYVWEINNATGTKGADPGYDWLNIGGTLTLNNTSGSKFTIYVTSLDLSNVGGNPAVNFAANQTYTFPIATATTDIAGFDADKFLIDTSAFFNEPGVSGSWSIVQSIDNKSLNLTFVTVPEPSTYATSIAALLGVVILLRRRLARP